MNINELDLLTRWLNTKLDNIPNTTVMENVYSEANLTKKILQFVKHLVEKERMDQLKQAHEVYSYGYNIGPHSAPSPYQMTYADNTSSADICPTCKAQNPQHSRCIHRK